MQGMKVFGFAGYSGSGKTTLIEKMIPILVARGLRISLIKHAHHEFDVDRPGKDSYRHRQAGATEILISSRKRWALMHELRDAPEPDLHSLMARMSPCDILLVEGYKREHIPKIEIYREGVGEGLLHVHDKNIIAVATDSRLDTRLPVLDLNSPAEIADFILEFLAIRPAGKAVQGKAVER